MARYTSRRPVPRRRRGGGCVGGLAGLLFVAALLVLIYAFAIRPLVSQAVADRIAGPTIPAPTLVAAGAPPQPQQAADQAVAQGGSVMPTAIAALPAGRLVVTDADINGFIAARPEAIAPLDGASVRFTAGAARAQVSAYGLNGIATISLAAQNGQVVVVGARFDAPLSYLLSADQLARALADRLNAELTAQNRRVDELRIEEGQLVLVTS